MKNFIVASLCCVLLGYFSVSIAEDVDLYSAAGGNAGVANVMVMVDDASNSNADMGVCSYFDGGVPSGGSKSLGNYQCALANVIHGMSVSSDGSALVRIGITTMTGVDMPLIPIDDNLYAGLAALTIAGHAVVIPAASTNRQAFILAVKALDTVSGKVGQGEEMQETYAYYTGGTGMLSGRAYAGTNALSGCQSNYAIFLSGVKANASHALDNGELPYLHAAAQLALSAGKITAAQYTALDPNAAGYSGAISNKPEAGYGIEWARFISKVDVNSGVSGTQRIVTYAIGTGNTAVPPAAITSSMEQYIQDVAIYGGGKYFAAGTSISELTSDLLKILNEVQAVNSVFSSSSLPVSVNTQGTYLNQVYMGMFRPDAAANPRWLGNLKQFQFIYDPATGSLKMGDSLGAAAISSAGTGFISPNAVSYWTCGGNPTLRACTPLADLASGFWVNNPQGAGGAYDLPDGELVEKGGAAQVMRLAYLNADYTTTASTSTNPRKLYSYCPAGTGCNAALANTANAFATSNANITATMFGASSSLNVTSIVRSGTQAVVTTSGVHGYSSGNIVTVSGAAQAEYNLTQAITVNSTTSFTISGIPDRPTTPSAGAYTVSLHNSGAQSIASIARSSSSTATARNSETATVTTVVPHGYATGNSVQITGASPADYNGIKTISVTSSTQFTYPLSIYPTTPASNTYKAVTHPYSRTLSSITKNVSTGTVMTTAAHGFHIGQLVTIAGTGQTVYNGNQTIVTVPSTTTFTFTGVSGHPGAITAGATVTPSTTPVNLAGISRTGTTLAATANVSGAAASAFANGDTLDLTLNTGAAANESAYVVSGVLISCSGTCTSFTYPLTATPALNATGSMSVALSGSPATIPAGSISRNGTTVTVTGIANGFISGNSVDIAPTGAAFADESAYVGTWTITCPSACSSAFTFAPVTQSPVSPATGHITAYQSATPPARDPLINWVRGQDNFGDEMGPGGSVTIRPSLHGDVLHSRPVVINYGGNTGVIVYYGANDGIYRAVNGNQTNPASSTLPVPGSELWGFIPTEFYGKLFRLRSNSPQLLLSSTPTGILPAPLRKDYFADGSTGVYQLLNANGTTGTAYIYLAMRRGGRLIYALDVSTPTNPQFLWKIDASGLTNASGFTASTDYAELGQTWSAPKVAQVEGYANPVLIFSAGYDAAEDLEPPAVDGMGRGIYVLDALTGALVWSATPQLSGFASACSGTSTKAACLVSGMNYSMPADITLVDRDGNGKIDRLYAVDVGGNVWRVDLQPTVAHQTPNYWQVNKLAALGCATGVCATGTTPRKFFYPADVIFTPAYDAVMVGQGDREHPLFTDAATNVRSRLWMLKDTHPGNDGSGSAAIIRSNMFDGTSTAYDGSGSGYYLTLGVGEKVVNAPLTVAGFTYFGTNQPVITIANSCNANLGIARGYKLAPFTATYTSSTYSGGGLPPSPVAGLVNISVTINGVVSNKLVPFLIGGGGDPNCVGADCLSALGGIKPTISVPTSRSRTYWYQEMD